MSCMPCYAPSAGVKPFECKKLLEEFLDQPQLIVQLLRLFIRETQKDIDLFVAALASKDAPLAAAIAHSLKGAAGTIGAEPLRAEAERLEKLGRQGQLQQTLECVPYLHNEFSRFCEYVAGLAAASKAAPMNPDSSH